MANEAFQVEIHSEDIENNNLKNLLLIRAMTAACDIDPLKEFMKKMMDENLVTKETF